MVKRKVLSKSQQKNLLRKTSEEKGDFQLALLNWRNTPTAGLNSSPAQRLFGRRTRTLVPTSTKLLKPQTVENVVTNKEQTQQKQKRWYDRRTRNLPPLRKGDVARVKPNPNARDKHWIKAEVLEQVDVRSYRVRTEYGQQYHRNRKHLRKTDEVFHRKADLFPDVHVNRDDEQRSTSFPNRDARNANSEVDTNREPRVARTANREAATSREARSADEYARPPPQPVRRSSRHRQPPLYMKDFVMYK